MSNLTAVDWTLHISHNGDKHAVDDSFIDIDCSSSRPFTLAATLPDGTALGINVCGHDANYREAEPVCFGAGRGMAEGPYSAADGGPTPESLYLTDNGFHYWPADSDRWSRTSSDGATWFLERDVRSFKTSHRSWSSRAVTDTVYLVAAALVDNEPVGIRRARLIMKNG